MTQQALIRLVVLQFSVYSVLGILGFLAWLLAFTDNLAILGVLVGGYVRGHLVRWTAQFPSWGAFILLSGAFRLLPHGLYGECGKKGWLRRTIIFSRIPNQHGLRPEPDSSQPLRDTHWLDTASTSFRHMEEPEVTNHTSA